MTPKKSALFAQQGGLAYGGYRSVASQQNMQGQQLSAAQVAANQNSAARNLIFSAAKPIFQRVGTRTLTVANPNNNTVINFPPLQIGFLRRFVVAITGTVTNTGSGVLTLTPNGADNLLTNVQFNDFTGNPRHNCSGRSLSYVEAAKYKRIPGAAYASDSVSGFGSIIPSNVAPATIANAASGTVTRVFEVPIMVDTGRNMAGGLWLGVNNQSTNLQLTVNPAAVVASAADPTQAIYSGVTGTLTNVSVTVYQDYWNNVPTATDQNGNTNPILPVNDINTAYMITETNSGLSFANNQAASWNFPTFSQLLGTSFTYVNGGTALNAGSDLSMIQLVVSNFANIKQYDPLTLSRVIRDALGVDMPKGSYQITSRMHPLDVSQYPSLQLQITPTSAPAGTYALITTELLRAVSYMTAASGVGGA